MCRIFSQTQSHHRLLLWGHKCAISYPRDTESPSLAIMGSHMCRIFSQTQSHHRLLLWGHTCAVSYPTHRVTIPCYSRGCTCAISYPKHRLINACYYGVTRVPYLIPDTESLSLAIMGSHMCHILSQSQSQHHLLLWDPVVHVPYLIPDTESPTLAIMGSHMCRYLFPDTESPSLSIIGTHICRVLSQTQSHHPLLLWGHTCAISYPDT